MLEIERLSAAYQDLQVLWDVGLEVRPGEIVAIVGANGAGKSTLLRCVSRLLAPRAARLSFNGVNMTRLPSHEVVALGIVQVPEGRHIFPEMTVAENLRIGSYVSHARAERQRNLERVYALFPRLSERQRQAGGTLSGGEQQMLAIARGLMAAPKLLLLDEPTLGLSPMLADQMIDTIEEINRQGTSVLLVEQNVYQSLRISARAYVLERGRVVLAGVGKELLDSPAVKAAFLGISIPPPPHSHIAPAGAGEGAGFGATFSARELEQPPCSRC